MHAANQRPRYRLELRPEPNCPNAVLALRRLLKRALRDYGLRCTAIEEIKCDERQNQAS